MEISKNCPQCKDLIHGNAKRIIKDSCGHEKCRVCLLLDVEGCRQCLENENIECLGNSSSPSPKQEVVDNHYTTVITYNNLHAECPRQLLTPSIEDLPESKEELQGPNTTNNNEISEVVSKNMSKKQYKHKASAEKRAYNVISVPEHISSEGKPPLFTCNICNSQFKTRGHVKYHEFCLQEKKPYSCDVCSKSFILKSQLYTHKLVHSGKKPHVCAICSKAFRESGTLKRHMILHSNEKSHVCDECGKRFKAPTYLKLHRLVHSGEKRYTCKYCKRKFSNSSNLKKHIASHSDDRTHMCEQCGKKFKQKWALSVHRRSHLPERNFSCRECNRTFINQKDLKRHELIHIDTKMYSCGLCSMLFRRKDNLGRHIRNAHPNKKAEIIKKVPDEPSDKARTQIVDNPNAINVITVSPMVKVGDNVKEKAKSSPRTCMNGPLKLAVKTSAFKRNYNINRDYTFDSNSRGESSTNKTYSENVEKIQSRPNPTSRLFSDLLYSTSNFSVDEFYASRPHVIKNIKFKIPENYPSSNEAILKSIISQSSVRKEREDVDGNRHGIEDHVTKDEANKGGFGERLQDKCDGEAKIEPVMATSVIVNSNDQRNIHWRRRMSQNIASKKL